MDIIKLFKVTSIKKITGLFLLIIIIIIIASWDCIFAYLYRYIQINTPEWNYLLFLKIVLFSERVKEPDNSSSNFRVQFIFYEIKIPQTGQVTSHRLI